MPGEMPLRLTHLPRVNSTNSMEFLARECGGKMLESVQPSEVPVVPINLFKARGSVSAVQLTLHLTETLVG